MARTRLLRIEFKYNVVVESVVFAQDVGIMTYLNDALGFRFETDIDLFIFIQFGLVLKLWKCGALFNSDLHSQRAKKFIDNFIT